MRRNIKKEKALYKTVNDIVCRLDSYEEIFPERYIDEKQRIKEKELRQLRETAEYFWKTDLYECISKLLEIEKHIAEKDMISAEEIMTALEMRDTLLLMSREYVYDKKELSVEIQLKYYKEKKESLNAAMTINNRTICIAEEYKNRLQAERTEKKLKIYFKLAADKIRELENWR